MLVDVNLDECLVLIAGAGDQAHKRAKILLEENCHIRIIGKSIDPRLEKLASSKLTIQKKEITDTTFIVGCGARIIIAATDNDELNATIVDAARAEPNCLAYCADGSSKSDYSHIAIETLSNSVQFGISTHGQSPIIARALRDRAMILLDNLVTDSDEVCITLYSILRSKAKDKIRSSSERRRFMKAIADDTRVKELIKDGQINVAQERAMMILDRWDNVKNNS